MPKDGKEITHPAYVTVGFSRCQGNPGTLFGSKLQKHGSFVALRISRASMNHHLGKDWIHGGNKDLIEVYLSAAQFAELLTTMNVFNGVPGTLRAFDGERIPPISDDVETEAERIQYSFKEDLDEFAEKLKDDAQEVEDILLAKGALKVSDRKEIVSKIRSIFTQVQSNMPFALDSFQRNVEKTQVQAKAELDAIVTQVIYDKGLEAIGEEPRLTEHVGLTDEELLGELVQFKKCATRLGMEIHYKRGLEDQLRLWDLEAIHKVPLDQRRVFVEEFNRRMKAKGITP